MAGNQGGVNLPMFNPTGAGGNMFSPSNAIGMPSSSQRVAYNPYSTTGGGYNMFGGGGGGFALPGGNGTQWNPGSFTQGTLFGNIAKDFGSGLGSGMINFINQGAGYNPNMINTLFQSMQPTIARNMASIDAASGVSGTRFSSAHDFATADYLGQVEAGLSAQNYQAYQHSNDLIAQMLMAMINPTAQINMNEPGVMDMIGGAMGLAGDAAGLLGGFGVPGFKGFKP